MNEFMETFIMQSTMMAGAIIATVWASTTSAAPVAREDDCEFAQDYYELAQERLRESDDDEAVEYLERAADACPRFVYSQELGELKARSGEDKEKRQAVDAFIEAYGLASSPREQARSLWKYAELLSDDGDPQNAYPLVLEAKRLDGSNEDIVALATDVQTQVENPTPGQLVRGLSDSLYKPIIISAAETTGQAPSGGSGADRTIQSGSAGPSDGIAFASTSQQATFVPIHFEFGSTRVDERTAKNIEVLALALVDDRLSGSGFVLVGHADARGTIEYNMVLSKRRADAIHDAVVELEPSLAGRISVTGKGEAEPIDLGTTDEAHWRNRRLQVLIQ